MTDVEREVLQREIAERDAKIHELMGELSDWKGDSPTYCRLDINDRCATILACHQVCQKFAGHEELAPPGASAMERGEAVAKQVFYHLVPGNLATLVARAIEQAERKASAAAIEIGLEAITFAHEWIGGLPVTPSFEDKRAAQAALELSSQKLRALADAKESES